MKRLASHKLTSNRLSVLERTLEHGGHENLLTVVQRSVAGLTRIIDLVHAVRQVFTPFVAGISFARKAGLVAILYEFTG